MTACMHQEVHQKPQRFVAPADFGTILTDARYQIEAGNIFWSSAAKQSRKFRQFSGTMSYVE